VGCGGAQRSDNRGSLDLRSRTYIYGGGWCGVARGVLRALSGGMRFVVGLWDLEGERRLGCISGRVVVQPGWSCMVWDWAEGGCIGAGMSL
jgi:hypothetical protein